MAKYFGKKIIQKSCAASHEKTEILHKNEGHAIESPDIPLMMKKRKMIVSKATDYEIETMMSKYYQKRANLEKFMSQAVKSLVPLNLFSKIMTEIPEVTIQLDCHAEAVQVFDNLCAPFNLNPFALRFSTHIANLCEYLGDSKPIIKYFVSKCEFGPLFYDVL